MARAPRSKQIDESVPGVYHCVSRCVRRAFLCGQDAVSGQDFDHRRQWIQDRLEHLGSCFLIDILGFGLMSNHFHCILRNRPDLVPMLSDVDVVMRWWRLSADSRADDGSTKTLSRRRLKSLLGDRKKIKEYRRRLSSISWLMSYLKQPIAVLANQEDGVSGRFWEGRFQAKPVESLEQLSAAMVYVDLNPIRACSATTPEASIYTGVYQRIKARRERRNWAARIREETTHVGQISRQLARQSLHKQVDAWLSPLEFNEQAERVIGPTPSEAPGKSTDLDLDAAMDEALRWSASPRASDRGCLPISLEKYLMLVDWTGRQLHHRQKGKIPSNVPSILKRLGFSNPAGWLAAFQEYAEKFSSMFSAPANPPPELARCGFPDAHPLAFL